MFTVTLFVLIKNGKQSKYSLTEEKINCALIIWYYSTYQEEGSRLLIHTKTWVNHKCILLGEISQTLKRLIWHTGKGKLKGDNSVLVNKSRGEEGCIWFQRGTGECGRIMELHFAFIVVAHSWLCMFLTTCRTVHWKKSDELHVDYTLI